MRLITVCILALFAAGELDGMTNRARLDSLYREAMTQIGPCTTEGKHQRI